VYSTCSGPTRACAAAASDGLAVPKSIRAIIAKGEVIHASLAGGAHFEALEDDVYDALGRQHIAGADSCFRTRTHERSIRDYYSDWLDTPMVEWDIRIDHAAESENDS
jgi:hypothetical protein